jgi:DNA-binding transcriptional LysR family regulator
VRGAEFAELTAFMAIVRERSFRGAAKRLGLSPSALSHTIRELEERLGVRLLNRTTRSVSPTEAGIGLFNRLEPAIADIEGAVGETGSLGTRPSGRVRLNLPRLAASLVLVPVLGRFAETYPDIHLDLTIDDAFADVVGEGFDAGIRVGERVERDMVAVRLTPDLRLAVVGAPSYFARRPPPRTPRELRNHACINYRWSGSGALYRWHFDGPDGPLDVDVGGPLTVNDTGIIIDAALAGSGLACLPETAVMQHLASSRLTRALDEWCRPFSGFFLYYPGRRHMPVPLRTLIAFLKQEDARAEPVAV